jgi:acetolactate decarboxylase
MPAYYQKIFQTILVLGLFYGLVTASQSSDLAMPKYDTLYHISTIDALLAGEYDGETTIAELSQHGNFGLGTFNGIDGEMIVYEGVVYQVIVTGEVRVASPQTLTPFATVNFFKADAMAPIATTPSYATLKSTLDAYVECRNYPCAFKIKGDFSYVKTRSEPKAEKPYPQLAPYIREHQRTFETTHIKGTLVGYRLPSYLAHTNVPGYHFHFISDDKKFGGHVLEVAIANATMQLDRMHDIEIALLRTDSFADANLSVEEDALHVVEHATTNAAPGYH